MAVFLDIKVYPSSSHAKMLVDEKGIVKMYVKSPAQDGKANQEIIKTLAKQLKITSSDIGIVKGATSRYKRLKINVPLSIGSVLQRLGFDQQLPLL